MQIVYEQNKMIFERVRLNDSMMDQFIPLQLALQEFCLVVNLWCTGLKRESDNKQNRMQTRVRTGKGGCSGVASLRVSCYS